MSSKTPKPAKTVNTHPASEVAKPDPFSPLAPSDRVGFAIVGLGKLALDEILPAFSRCQFAKPVALVSGDPEKAANVAAQYGIAPGSIYSYERYDELKTNPEVKAVYIALPNSMHCEYTVRAAKAGKHVLCEKPMATTVADAKSMIAACQKAGVKLMIAYRIQYEPMNTLIRDWVRSEKYGKVRVIDAVHGQNESDPSQWRLKMALAGGGPLPDVGVYCINTIRFLLGEEPVEVVASTYTTPGDARFTEVEETVLWQMRFPGGTVANCMCSYSIHEARHYRCYADRGAWFGMDPAFPYRGLKFQASIVEKGVENRVSPLIGEKDHFALEIDHFAKVSVMDGEEPYTPGEEGLQDQVIMDAIYQSARTRRPVTLPRLTRTDPFRGTEP